MNIQNVQTILLHIPDSEYTDMWIRIKFNFSIFDHNVNEMKPSERVIL